MDRTPVLKDKKCSIREDRVLLPCAALKGVMEPGIPKDGYKGVYQWQDYELGYTSNFVAVKSGKQLTKGVVFRFCPFCGRRIEPPPPPFVPKYNQRVVCSAIKNVKTGELILGVRHYDEITGRQIEAFDPDLLEWGNEHTEQGFVDNFGNFLTRTEAYAVALKQNQILRDHQRVDELYSEHIC